MKVLAAVIIMLIIIICLLIDELVKMSRLLDLYESELIKAHKEIQKLQQSGNMETIIYNGDLFIDGSLSTGADGCMVIEGGLTFDISKSSDADEWRDACLECPNIVDGNLCLEGKMVKVYGDVYVWLDAVATPGTTGFISCSALQPHMVLNADRKK